MKIEVQPSTLGELETLAAKVRKSPADLAATFVADAVISYGDQPEELAASFAEV